MTMQSLQLLPALQELSATDGSRRSARQIIEELARTDPALHAAEFTASVSFAMWGIWDEINVDDTLVRAYDPQYPGLAADHSLHEQWLMMNEQGPGLMQGFVSGLKGKVAEFDFAQRLEEQGYTNVTIAADPTQGIFDITATNPLGEFELWQVKTVGAEQASEVMNRMLDSPDVLFAVSSEAFEKIASSNPALTEQMMDIGSTVELEEGVTEGLDLLADNLGIDVPDGLGNIIPYAGAIIAGARLVHGAVRNEQQFKAVDRTNRNKIQVVQALTIMSRMGVTTVLSTVGGMGGATAGSFIPGIGNLIGGIAGAVTGAGMAMYLNRHLQPHMLSLALDITGLTNDDLFYFKNKPHIDQVAWSFWQAADDLTIHYATAWQPALTGATYPTTEPRTALVMQLTQVLKNRIAAHPAMGVQTTLRQLISGATPRDRVDQGATPEPTTAITVPNGRQCIDGKVGSRCPNIATVGYYCSEHGKS